MRVVAIEVIAKPTDLPVTAEEYIDHARLNGLTVQKQPEMIERKLKAATMRAERFCRRSLLTQTLKAGFVADGKSCACTLMMVLPRGKVQSVTSVSSAGVTIDPAGYTVNLEAGIVTLNWPLYAPATVEWVSGYGDTGEDVPDLIIEGILEYATTIYEQRAGERDAKYVGSASGSYGTLPTGVRDCWRPFQIEIGAS